MKLGAMEHIVAAADERATFARAARLGLAGVEARILRAHLRDPEETRLRRLVQAQKAISLAITGLELA